MEGRHFKFTEMYCDDGYQYSMLSLFSHYFTTLRVRESISDTAPIVIHWVVDFLEKKPQPIYGKIESDIKKNLSEGKKIDYLIINPLTAGYLWLEGKLTDNEFSNAIEDEESITFFLQFNSGFIKTLIKNIDVAFSIIIKAD